MAQDGTILLDNQLSEAFQQLMALLNVVREWLPLLIFLLQVLLDEELWVSQDVDRAFQDLPRHGCVNTLCLSCHLLPETVIDLLQQIELRFTISPASIFVF